jgi:hypothetical protein
MSALRAIGRFLASFLIGDDWRLPAGVAGCLAVAAVLLTTSVPAEFVAVLTGLAIAGWFSVCLLRDVRRVNR